MSEIHDRAIIWHVRPYRETDALVLVLTANGGKLSLIAKGLRGAKSKRKGTLQAFSVLDIAYTPARNDQGLGQLRHSEFVFAPHAPDPLVYAVLALAAEISARFIHEHQHIPGIFPLWTEFLQIPLHKPSQELCGFLVQFLSGSGFFPEVRFCAECGKKFTAEKKLFWKYGSGVFCCGLSSLEQESETCQQLEFNEVKSMWFFCNTQPQGFAKLMLTKSAQDRLLQLLFREIEEHSDRPFAAKKVFLSLQKA